MARHTDFTRLRGSAQPSPRRGGPRNALFSEYDGKLRVVPDESEETATDVAGPAFVLDCSECGAKSRVGLIGVMLAATPSLHLPLVKRDYPSFMRCPRCQAHRWVSIGFDFGR